jgi:hypothetical protein
MLVNAPVQGAPLLESGTFAIFAGSAPAFLSDNQNPHILRDKCP